MLLRDDLTGLVLELLRDLTGLLLSGFLDDVLGGEGLALLLRGDDMGLCELLCRVLARTETGLMLLPFLGLKGLLLRLLAGLLVGLLLNPLFPRDVRGGLPLTLGL